MTRALDYLRMVLMVAGATGAALLAAHIVLTLIVVALTVATTIGLYELTHP